MPEVRYTLTVYLTVPVEDGDDPEAYLTQKEKSRLERSVVQALKKLDGDADCEVQDAVVIWEYTGGPAFG